MTSEDRTFQPRQDDESHEEFVVRLNQEYGNRKAHLRIAPRPEGDDVPTWMHDGVEELYGCFNETADIWDLKFQEPELYGAVADPIPRTQAAIRILDLGCGTGQQLEPVFEKVPNARVTGIDLAEKMLEQLRRKFSSKASQLTLKQGSYLHLPLGSEEYDYAIATLTMHHLPPKNKQRVYEKIGRALRPGGTYIEGDTTDKTQAEEEEGLYWYNRWIAKLPKGDEAEWNYDINLCPDTNMRLLNNAGFSEIKHTWSKGTLAVLVARM